MNRTKYKAMSTAYRGYQRNSRWVQEDRFTKYPACPPMPPQAPRSAVGQLLLDQAERRKHKLYWIGLRARDRARAAA